MSSKKSEKIDDIKLYKSPLSASQLVASLLFSTYFLTVQLIELSLSIYVLKENKSEIYKEYLIFKSESLIWKPWQIFALITIPLGVFGAIKDLIQVFTKKATKKRNLIDILAALQLFSVLFIVFTRILPLEKKLIQLTTKDYLYDLNFFQWIVFILNVCGWFTPILKYEESKNHSHIKLDKKNQ
jgi:hypothetical protein